MPFSPTTVCWPFLLSFLEIYLTPCHINFKALWLIQIDAQTLVVCACKNLNRMGGRGLLPGKVALVHLLAVVRDEFSEQYSYLGKIEALFSFFENSLDPLVSVSYWED